MREHVVLVDEKNNPTGQADKYLVHSSNTPLHRGFSLFLFNQHGQLLLQKRAAIKKTWPNVWSNSVCGHPASGESVAEAARRRAAYELNIALDPKNIHVILSDYRYSYEHQGIVENEICPVMVAFGDFKPQPNPDEVADTRWVNWQDFLSEIKKPNHYSQWCQEEAQLLDANIEFNKLFSSHTTSA